MNRDKKIIYFLVALIIFFSIILLIKIKTTPKYDSKLYEEIYNEYEDIFEKNDNTQKNGNIQQSNNIIEENNTPAVDTEHITSINKENGNVIGQIIIPKIDIKYPIIKETTTEYLKVAPTKYCGPEVNDIRKFGYSRT